MTRLRNGLPVAAAVVAALAIAPQGAVAGTGCSHANADPNRVSLKKVRRATLCLLNRKRHEHGLSNLRENGRLDRASQQHAADMARRKYFEHGDFIGRIKRSRYLSGAGRWTVGENIAWGAGSYARPKAIVKMWMHSPGHRANILSHSFREIGIGIARGAPVRGMSDGATYATDFGARS